MGAGRSLVATGGWEGQGEWGVTANEVRVCQGR